VFISNQNKEAAGISANTLKFIAIVTMLIDHTADALVSPDTPLYILMRMIGRITAPIMFFFLAEGYHYTRDRKKYAVRLAVFAAVSYLPFVWFVTGGPPNPETFLKLNVIYTLLIGLLAIMADQEMESGSRKSLVLLVLILLSMPGDWSAIGLLYILTFSRYRENRKRQTKVYLLITLLLCAMNGAYPLYSLIRGQAVDSLYVSAAVINLGMFLPILLLQFYNGEKGRGGKWAQWGFYVFYPAHLILLSLITMYRM